MVLWLDVMAVYTGNWPRGICKNRAPMCQIVDHAGRLAAVGAGCGCWFLPSARDIADELTGREVKLSFGGSVHDPADSVGRLLFNVLGMVAEFGSGLIRMRTREGHESRQGPRPASRRAAGTHARQEAHLGALHEAGEHANAGLADLFASASPALRLGRLEQAGDGAEQAFGVELRGGRVADDLAEAQHHDPVGYLEYMRQGVRDEDDSEPLLLGGLDH